MATFNQIAGNISIAAGQSIRRNAGDTAFEAFAAGDVAGAASSTDNAVVRFDSTTGKVIQNSGVKLDDSDMFVWNADVGLKRGGAGVLRITDGASSNPYGYLESIGALFNSGTNGVSINYHTGGGFDFGSAGTINWNSGAVGSGTKDVGLKRSAAGVIQITDGSSGGGALKTGAPSGGTAGVWKIGVAASVSPILPNRTIEVEVDGVVLYIHAKTTND